MIELTAEEQQCRNERLQVAANEGEAMRDFVRHPGFKILERLVNGKITDTKNAWLNAKSKEEAEEIRLQTKPWNEVFELIFNKIKNGDNAVLQMRASSQGE